MSSDALIERPTLLDYTVFLSLDRLLEANPQLGGRRKAVQQTERALDAIQGCWTPRAVLELCAVAEVSQEIIRLSCSSSTIGGTCNLGYSARFMAQARQAFVGAYTLGEGVEAAITAATREKRILDAYTYDLIGLTVLEMTRMRVCRFIEEQAARKGWGVGPFLSPGSVHGWDLDEQAAFCRLFPLPMIGAQCSDTGVLRPLLTISFIVGMGPGYRAKEVGSTCEVCARRGKCEHQSQPAG